MSVGKTSVDMVRDEKELIIVVEPMRDIVTPFPFIKLS